MLTVAVGDIHGCYKQLTYLLEHVKHWMLGREYRYVFLGDYCDRGPDTRKVLDYLMYLSTTNQDRAPDAQHVFLRGNHEDMMLGESPNFKHNGPFNGFSNWISNGGDKTLESFGLKRGKHWDVGDWQVMDKFTIYKTWIEDTCDFMEIENGDYGQRVYVHAGIERSVPLQEQNQEVMTWIRDPFLNNVSPKGGYVVHGHTPHKHVEFRKNRINLDTGCCFAEEYGPKYSLSAGVFNETKAEPEVIINHKGVYEYPHD
jgi:serine/threonine protein phosphatase 1